MKVAGGHRVKRGVRTGLLILLGSFFSQCVAPLPESRMAKVADMAPDSWSASKEGRGGVDRAWVSRFKDPKLSSLVREAMRKNTEISAAAERVIQAQQTAYLAGSSRRPFLSTGLNGNRDKTQFVGFPFGGSQTTTRYSSQLNASWELDLWGQVRAGESAAYADAEALALDLKASQASLAGQVCKAYFALAEGQRQVSLAERSLRIREETQALVEDRYEQSLSEEGGSASQLRLAQTEVASAAAVLAQRKGEVEVAKRQLELLVGRQPSGRVSSTRVLQRLPKHPPVGIPSEVLQRRPDIVAAERRYSATGHRVREAKLAPFPSLSLTGALGTATDSLSSVLDSSLGTWSLGAAIGQNILVGGQVVGETKLRESRDRENLANLQRVVLRAFSEVEVTLSQDKWLRNQITELERAESLAKEAAVAAGADFENGIVDALTLLTTRTRAIELEGQVLSLRRLQLENRVDLHLALGGEFQQQNQ